MWLMLIDEHAATVSLPETAGLGQWDWPLLH